MRFRLLAVGALVVCGAAAPGVRAQDNLVSGAITGLVKDSTGGRLPGVTVAATSLNTAVKRSTVSAPDGSFTIQVLWPGTYRVDAELSGLGQASVPVVRVWLGNTTRTDLTIAPQASDDTITVSTEQPAIDVRRTSTATSVTRKELEGLPILTRDFLSLVGLAPGVVEASGGRLAGNGARGVSTDYTVDGVSSTNVFGEHTGGTRAPFTFPLSGVQEFQVTTAHYDAESARSGGLQISAITRRGTNDVQGQLFWFVRPSGWNATLPSTLSNGQTVVDSVRARDTVQAGGAVGGAIVRDRLFYFTSIGTQRQRVGVTSTDVRVTPPFKNLPAGDQTKWLDQIAAIEGGTYDSQLKYDQTFNQNTYLFKVDLNAGAGTRVSVRDNYSDFENADNQSARNLSNQVTEHDTFNQLVGQVTTVLTPRLLNEIIAGSTVDQRPVTSRLAGPEVRVAGFVPGFLLYGKNAEAPANTREITVQFKDSMRYAIGNHTLKFGAEGIFRHIDRRAAPNQDGVFLYNTVSQFLNDTPNLYLQGYGPGDGLTSWHQHTFAFFAADSFRPIPRLTVDVGLRYDWQTMPVPPANAFPQHPEFLTDFRIDRNNLAPRFGLAYDLGGDGKSVVRAGAGRFFSYSPAILMANPISTIAGSFLQATLPCASSTVPCPTYPDRLTPTQLNQLGLSAATDIVTVSPRYGATQSWQFSAELQREVNRRFLFSVGGAFASLSQVQGSRNVNATPSGTSLGDLPVYDLGSPTRPYTDMGVVRQLCSCETASSRALVLALRGSGSRRMPWLNLSYTFAKAIDQDSNEASTSSSFLYDPNNSALSEGPSDTDVRHRFVGTAMYRLPWYGIDVAAIFQARSGLPYTPGIAFTGFGTTAVSLNGLSQVAGNVPVFSNATGAIIDLTLPAYNGVTRQQLSDALASAGARLIGRNAYRQPAWHGFDLRVTKTFDLHVGAQAVQLQLVAEGFNLFNTQNLFVSPANQDKFRATFASTLGLYSFASFPNFGLANSYASPQPRQGQFSVKVIF